MGEDCDGITLSLEVEVGFTKKDGAAVDGLWSLCPALEFSNGCTSGTFGTAGASSLDAFIAVEP